VTGIETNAQQLVDWWRQMLTIRLFEEKVQELQLQGLVPGTTHLCQGQEAVSVGAIAASVVPCT
jgi:TPP-dependent pyruvate/acetoin dehydrogenase alpha subunit